MVDWKLVHFRPPKTQKEWEEYFEKYKQFPEYDLYALAATYTCSRLNRDMNVEQFKRIYWMEHAHRVYGRLLGLYIVVPSVFFIARKWGTARQRTVMVAASGLVAFQVSSSKISVSQGLLGWYMVKSGLRPEIALEKSRPRVSQYRLAAHLAAALGLYSLLFTCGISALSKTGLAAKPPLFWKSAIRGVTGLIFATALAGAFVAGLDAGQIYNSFPLMGDRLIPSDIWIPDLGLRNLFENPATAQFVHRTLAYAAVSATSLMYILSLGKGPDQLLRERLLYLLGAVWMQASLGAATILMFVPTSLASAHQVGSLAALSTALYLGQALKKIPK